MGDGLDQKPSRNRPCDACRRRKSRCAWNDGAVKCVLCMFHTQNCTFSEEVPPRKRKSVSCDDGSDRLPDETVRRRLSSGGEKLKREAEIVPDYSELKGPTLLRRTLGLQRAHHGLYIGLSGRFERGLIVNSDTAKATESSHNQSFRHVSEDDMFVVRPDLGTVSYGNEAEDLDAIEYAVAPHGRTLIDLYFRIIHPSFPILHKRVYLEKYERSYREFSPALLAAVYVLASVYWNYSPEISHASMPDVLLLEKLALKALAYAIHRPKLSTVEAGLLLLQRSGTASWSLTAQMVAVGQDIGLHRDCTTWDIPDWEKGLRKRLGWALFMQDKWASLVHGRPSHIHTADWLVKPLDDHDFPENFADEDDEDGSTEVENGRTLFTWMVSLTMILSHILSSLYSGEAPPYESDATKHVLTKAKPLQIRLKEWYGSLPTCLGTEHVKLRKLSSTGYLHLAYWATEMTLHRCIARTLPSCTDMELVAICRSAASARAQSAIAFVNNLRPEHWQSFWYFASEFNFGLIGVFQMLVDSIASAENVTARRGKNVDQYRWSLKLARQNAAFLDRSIAMIDMALISASMKQASPHNGIAHSSRSESVMTSMTMSGPKNNRYAKEEALQTSRNDPSQANRLSNNLEISGKDHERELWAKDNFSDFVPTINDSVFEETNYTNFSP